MNPELMRLLQGMGINTGQLLPAGTGASRGVFMGYGPARPAPRTTAPSPTEVSAGLIGDEPEPQYQPKENVLAMYYSPTAEGSALRSRFSYSDWSQIVGIAEQQAAAGFYQTPFDIAAIMAGQGGGGGGMGRAPLSQLDAEASTQSVYRQTLGRDARPGELSSGASTMRRVYGGGNSMAAAGEAVLQDVRDTREYQAELGDDVLDSMYQILSQRIARTRR